MFGGPHGVRQIVFALCRVGHSLDRVEERASCPAEIRRVIGRPQWDSDRLEAQLGNCINELRRQVAQSSSVLQLTFSDRAQAWKEEVTRQYRARKDAGTIWPRPLSEPQENISSGVPSSAAALEAIWKTIKPRRARSLEPDESVEASRVMPIIPRPCQRISDDTDDERELIVLPADSELSGSSDEEPPCELICEH